MKNQFTPFKVSSIYGLLSDTPILEKLEISHMITLPFLSGCKYVAYQARDTKKVRQFDLDNLNNVILEGGNSCLV